MTHQKVTHRTEEQEQAAEAAFKEFIKIYDSDLTRLFEIVRLHRTLPGDAETLRKVVDEISQRLKRVADILEESGIG